MATTTAVEVERFDSPDETRPFEGKGHADVVTVAGQTVGRAMTPRSSATRLAVVFETDARAQPPLSPGRSRG